MIDQLPATLSYEVIILAAMYYLHRDQELHALGKRLPRSSRTIWRILYTAGLIDREAPARHTPLGTP